MPAAWARRRRAAGRPGPACPWPPHPKLARGEVHVLHAQREALEETEPRSVEEARHEPRLALEALEERAHLRPREHDGQVPRPLRAHETLELPDRQPEHVPVEEHERVQRLVLRRRRHPALAGQVTQERRDLRRPEADRMALPVEEDEAPHPVDVGVLCARAVVPHPKLRPHPIEQPRRLRAGSAVVRPLPVPRPP